MIEAADLRRLIDAADVHMRPMILLGVNCAYGNNDVGTLPIEAVDLAGGWLSYHRPKTGIARRCKLWPETIAALEASLAKRPKAKTPEVEPLFFVTKYGASWAKDGIDNPVSKAFRKLLDKSKLHRPGVSFYSLRHVHRTIADGAKDQPAANAIMGHADTSMADRYRERIDDERLEAVAEHVRRWLYPASAKQPKATKRKPKPRRAASQPVESATAKFRIVG
jgi:integrase